MHLLLIRHAIAEERQQWSITGRPDSDRPLTAKGVERFQEAARGLELFVPAIGRIITSPYRRAKETGTLLLASYPEAVLEESASLAPDHPPQSVAEAIKGSPDDAWVALVGHEPDLSLLLAHLICADGRPKKSRAPLHTFTELKKGGVALIEFPSRGEVGSGILRLLLTPRVLRQLAKDSPSAGHSSDREKVRSRGRVREVNE